MMLEAITADRHSPGTSGARDVRTPSLTELALGVEAAIARRGLVAVDGPPGMGKTFAIKLVLERLSIRRWYLPFGPDPTGKSVEVDMLQAIYDERHVGKEAPQVDRGLLRAEMRTKIREAFAEPGLFVIDDFTKSGLVGVGVIRWLLAQLGNKTAVVLLGNELDPLLRRDAAFYSRIIRIIPFDPIPDEAIDETIRPYHELFASAPLDLLLRINREHTSGSFRDWANFLATAQEVIAARGAKKLTDAIAVETIDVINKRPRNRQAGR